MRTFLPIGLFLSAILGILSPEAGGQTKAKVDPKAKNKFAPPAALKPDEATLKAVADKTAKLREAVESLKAKRIPDDVLVEVAIYLKGAENIVKFEEWFHKDSAKWTLAMLDRGLERAKQAESGKAPWRDQPGKWVVRAYRSQVDGSIQPYAVQLPHEFGMDPKKKWRLDIVLHGRDSTITEPKFLATHDSVKETPKDQPYVQLEVYGRGNNAYRWAGESDVIEAVESFLNPTGAAKIEHAIDPARVVLRGFSMGGAGTWHLGLQHPFAFAVIGPGAGFTNTHGYIRDLPNPLPDYQEKCLNIYDAERYAENVFNVPVVAYSGEKDAQKAAADNIENLVKAYPEKLRFTHLIAPGLEHQMPAEWQAKAQAEYQKYVGPGLQFPERIHYVTYTLRFPDFGWGQIEGLEEHYKKSIIDGDWTKDKLVLKTENIRAFRLRAESPKQYRVPALPASVLIDGQSVALPSTAEKSDVIFRKVQGRWAVDSSDANAAVLEKRPHLQGPIDDAFMNSFVVVGPEQPGLHAATDDYAKANQARFAREWDKWMRGTLPTASASSIGDRPKNLILFGDPQSNPLIAKVIDKLPVTWTKEKLVVNGVEYDAKNHVPAMIYPNPLMPGTYLVINSGHTFHDADFKGTNALLYPRLGDWAVLKPVPSAKNPAAAEVVAAGLFDEFWKFPKK